MSYGVIIIVAGTFVFAVIATGLMRSYALKSDLLDVPNLRSSHSRPTPRGAGVAIVAAFLGAMTAIASIRPIDSNVSIALILGGVVMAAVGFADDRRPLPVCLRFSVHLAAALLAVILLGGIPERTLVNFGLHGVWAGGTIAVLALVWTSNLFNFMDGIDGIAGSEAVFVAVSGAWLNWQQNGDLALTIAALSIAAASLGFLLWNWPPARIFMGDAGSGFLGFTLATLALAISQSGAMRIEVWAILGGVFLVDATVTLVRRMLRGDRWFDAHRMHAYQRLARRLDGHLPVTLLITLINVVWLLPWAWVASVFPDRAVWCVAAALIPLSVLAYACGAGSRES